MSALRLARDPEYRALPFPRIGICLPGGDGDALDCIAVFGGLILATDLRLLGLALTDMPIADVVNGLRNWKRLGFVIMVTMGLLLGLSEMDKYYANPYFQIKMFLIVMVGVHAIIFRPRVYDHPEELDRAPQIPRVAKTAAICSLLIWIAIPCLGRWIAYYEPPKAERDAVRAAYGRSQ